jgi:NitT/TauT family transport system substrate-binding protein
MKTRIGCILLILLSFPGPTNAQGKPEKEKIRIGYAARVVAHSIPYLAAQVGLFREEGVQVEVVQTAGSVAPMALIAGEVDFSIMSAFLLIPVSVQSGDVIMLGAFSRYATMTLISSSEIRTAEELRGKMIGLQRPGDATEINARFALRHLGLDPSRDVSLLYLGSNELMWPALQTKKGCSDCAATALDTSGTQVRNELSRRSLQSQDRISRIDLGHPKILYQGQPCGDPPNSSRYRAWRSLLLQP